MLFPLLYIHVPSEICNHIMLPKVFTHLLWMLPWMSTTEVIISHLSPREALMVGCWVTALPLLFCGIDFVSPPIEVVLCGVGLVHLSHA